jgi:polyisoprenoid-binding protein YceI
MASKCVLWCGLAACLPLAAVAGPVDYHLDPVHTRVLFAVSHAGFSHALGTVSGSTGALAFDPDDWSTAKLSVSVPLTRLDMGDAKWNAAVGARNLLDVAEHPVATFVSSGITPKDAQHAAVCGTLTLRGVGQEVCLDVTFNQLKHHPMPPFRRTAGFSATAKLSRKAFGMDAWPTVIGDEVELRIEAEAVRGGLDDNAPQPQAPQPQATPPDQPPGSTPPIEPSEPSEPTQPTEPTTEPGKTP